MKIVSRRRRRPAGSSRLIARGAFIDLLRSAFHPRWEPGREKFCSVADSLYYLPSHRQVERIVRQYRRRVAQYAGNRFDCDDFAWTLKSAFCQIGGARPRKPAGWAIGIIWTESDPERGAEGHAYNWVVTKDREVWLIEPQNGAKWRFGDRHEVRGINYDRNITLIVG
jgi:hypothetical protein